jgi:hypothetical protein
VNRTAAPEGNSMVVFNMYVSLSALRNIDTKLIPSFHELQRGDMFVENENKNKSQPCKGDMFRICEIDFYNFLCF